MEINRAIFMVTANQIAYCKAINKSKPVRKADDYSKYKSIFDDIYDSAESLIEHLEEAKYRLINEGCKSEEIESIFGDYYKTADEIVASMEKIGFKMYQGMGDIDGKLKALAELREKRKVKPSSNQDSQAVYDAMMDFVDNY